MEESIKEIGDHQDDNKKGYCPHWLTVLGKFPLRYSNSVSVIIVESPADSIFLGFFYHTSRPNPSQSKGRERLYLYFYDAGGFCRGAPSGSADPVLLVVSLVVFLGLGELGGRDELRDDPLLESA